jgi:hypothetical protein
MGTVISMCTAYNFLIEFTPKKSKILAGTLFLSIQILPAIALPLYLGLISNNAENFLMAGYIMTLSGFLLLHILPESPQYLFMKEEYLLC